MRNQEYSFRILSVAAMGDAVMLNHAVYNNSFLRWSKKDKRF
jgi:hypothetical protein